MMTKELFCVAALLISDWSYAQVPIDPEWTRLLASSSHTAKLALDHANNRLHMAYQPGPSDPHIHIHAFNTDGSDVPEPYTELTLGAFLPAWLTTGYPGTNDAPLRLLAENDTISYISRFLDDWSYMDWYRTGRISIDSATTLAIHTGGSPQVDFHHDHFGDISVSPTIIRSFNTRHWLKGRAVVPTTDCIAADETRIYCGRIPNITVVDRISMALVPPLVVPSSGTSTCTLLKLTGDEINYSSVNSNLTMNVGAVNTTGTVIWNTILSTTQYATLSGLTMDGAGNMWVALSLNGSTPSGLLYRFSPEGFLTGNYTYGRSIDDIVCSGDRVFLSGWDATQSTMVYLAAFATDITTSIPADIGTHLRVLPNPASSEMRVDGLPSGMVRMSITDAVGRVVKEIPGPCSGSISISVTDLPNGTYLVRCDAYGLVTTRPVNVVH